MSARTALAGNLTTALPTGDYLIKRGAPTGSKIAAGKVHVQIMRAGLVPSKVTSGWAQALVVLVLVGAEDFEIAEDFLDEKLPPVVTAIENLGHEIVTIDRDTFYGTDETSGFHGYRITTTVTTPTI